MPYEIIKTKNGFGVKNTDTGKLKSKDISKEDAEAQKRLLEGIKHGGWKPTGKKRRK